MREERGQLSGDVVVAETYTLWGTIAGNVRVIEGGKMYVRGAVYGNLTVEAGGRVHVYGNVSGDLVVHRKAKVIHSGLLGGDAVNQGGRLYVDEMGKVNGKVKTKAGETKVHGAAAK
jgi:cytoskeletal protein CcmA (bactofilin family)